MDLLTEGTTSRDHGRDQGRVFSCVCTGLLGVGTGEQLGVELGWREKERERAR